MDNENSSAIASGLSHRIAYIVIKSPSEAHIKKDFIVSLFDQRKNDSKIKNLFTDLINLFGGDTEIPIIGNMQLNNRALKNMTTTMSSDISKANEAVTTSVQKRLPEY